MRDLYGMQSTRASGRKELGMQSTRASGGKELGMQSTRASGGKELGMQSTRASCGKELCMHKTRVLRKRNAMYHKKASPPVRWGQGSCPLKFAACCVSPQASRSELAAHEDGWWVRPLTIELCPESKAGKSRALLARAQCTCSCCALCAEREVANS
jgi:hypothetical protein